MIRINQLKLPIGHTREEMEQQLAKELQIAVKRIQKYEIRKQSIDARKQPILYVYTADVWLEGEKQILKKIHNKNVTLAEEMSYHFPKPGDKPLAHPPVIVGTGPAGLFCGLLLARAGYQPILLERGEEAAKRKKTVDHFWATGELASDSNVQFGEGGAGTFSDGKLNTLVKDPKGRNGEVLKIFVQAGAPEEILYRNKPHLGTDILIGVVQRIREEILEFGGQIWFESQMIDMDIREGRVRGIHVIKKENGRKQQDYLRHP